MIAFSVSVSFSSIKVFTFVLYTDVECLKHSQLDIALCNFIEYIVDVDVENTEHVKKESRSQQYVSYLSL